MNPIIPQIVRILKECYVYENFCKFCYLCNINFEIFNCNDKILVHRLFNFHLPFNDVNWDELRGQDKNLHFWYVVSVHFKDCYWNESFHLNEFRNALEDLVIIYDMI